MNSNVEMMGTVEWQNLGTSPAKSEFVCAGEVNDSEISAGVESGELEPWRIDAAGNRWYRRRSRMIGAPAGGAMALRPAQRNPK